MFDLAGKDSYPSHVGRLQLAWTASGVIGIGWYAAQPLMA